MRTYKALGDYLRQCREKTDKKSYEVADEIGMSRAQFSRIEKGFRSLNSDYISKLCKATNADEEKIMTLQAQSEEKPRKVLSNIDPKEDILAIIKTAVATNPKQITFEHLLCLISLQRTLPNPMSVLMAKEALKNLAQNK